MAAITPREPEAEHRRRKESGDEHLGAEDGGAEAGRQLDLAHPDHRP
jgi:hypothetical protein